MALVASGCSPGSHASKTKATLVYVDMNRLVEANPAWQSLNVLGAASDAAKAALISREKEGGAAPAGYSIDPLSTPGVAIPKPSLDRERERLQIVADGEIIKLRDRLAVARAGQVEREALAWKSAAQIRLQAQRDAIGAEYLAKLEALGGADQEAWLNLTLQVAALTKLVANWSGVTPPPPAPQYEQAKRDLVTMKTALAEIERKRGGLFARIAAERDRLLAAADVEAAESVRKQRAARLAELEAQDEAHTRSEREDLERQIDAVIASVSVGPASGSIPAQTLRQFTASAVPGGGAVGDDTGGSGSFTSARSTLGQQKSAWAAYLYRETFDSAAAAAADRHWILTLKPSPTAVDRTQEIAKVLRQTLWRS